MPSGNTHILLVSNLPEETFTDPLKAILDDGIYFLQAGAVGPDLPYASIADRDLFITTQTDLADKFHYENTNQIPLLAFKELKLYATSISTKELRYSFAFFIGYMSHVIADGIMHPFVRDKVGDYKENASAHRELEMKLDVLVFHEFTKTSGLALELNHARIFEELKNLNGYKEKTRVMKLFAQLIRDVYGITIEDSQILDWLDGLYNLFKASEGNYPQIMRGIGFINSFFSPLYAEIENDAEDILTLRKPKDPGQPANFLKKDRIHFIRDCIPHFNHIFSKLTKKAYAYIFESGPELSEADFFEIDLDTGRPIAQKDNMNLIPTFWS